MVGYHDIFLGYKDTEFIKILRLETDEKLKKRFKDIIFDIITKTVFYNDESVESQLILILRSLISNKIERYFNSIGISFDDVKTISHYYDSYIEGSIYLVFNYKKKDVTYEVYIGRDYIIRKIVEIIPNDKLPESMKMFELSNVNFECVDNSTKITFETEIDVNCIFDTII